MAPSAPAADQNILVLAPGDWEKVDQNMFNDIWNLAIKRFEKYIKF